MRLPEYVELERLRRLLERKARRSEVVPTFVIARVPDDYSYSQDDIETQPLPVF
jgi:hypothetical protein